MSGSYPASDSGVAGCVLLLWTEMKPKKRDLPRQPEEQTEADEIHNYAR